MLMDNICGFIHQDHQRIQAAIDSVVVGHSTLPTIPVPDPLVIVGCVLWDSESLMARGGTDGCQPSRSLSDCWQMAAQRNHWQSLRPRGSA